MLREPWTVQLLGELRATYGPQVITRFYTHKIGGLFAYLAYYPQRAHLREELIDLFWPEAEPEAGRTSLRTALASLRRQLEPPSVPAGTMLLADRSSVRLNPESIRTDVAQFDREIQAAASAASPAERSEILERAVALYRGDLLPGRYEEWIVLERARLSEACCGALRQLSLALEEQGDTARAIDTARRAVQMNPLEEEIHFDLIRQHAAAGQLSAATRQYEELERALREAFDEAPSRSLQDLIKAARSTRLAARSGGTRPSRSPEVLPSSELRAASCVLRAAPQAHLPAPLTPFFGREAEIHQVTLLLDAPEARLVTLTGLGGTGKTRLALEVARRVRDAPSRFAGTAPVVAFVPLVDIRDARLIGEAVRAAMRMPASAAGDPVEPIVAALDGQAALLVLDNFEQLLPEGQEFVRRLLEWLPLLTCLVTSRLSLGLTAEWEFPVAPLPTPATPATPEHLLEFPSVLLFTSRAQAVRPDFQVTPANAQVVGQLCHSLEGIPLALELAAAHAQVLTPSQMLAQLSHRFDLLASRRRDMAERHRTLRAAMDWSYDLLPEELRQFLARLSVFRGGWTLEAAAWIAALSAEDDRSTTADDRRPTANDRGYPVRRGPRSVGGSQAVLDALEQLREHSLVVAEETALGSRLSALGPVRAGPLSPAESREPRAESGSEATMRFRMLETVRDYAEEKLAASSEADRVRQRHVRYFAQLAHAAEPNLTGAEQAVWLDRLEAEHDNFRAALEVCGSASGAAPGAWRLALGGEVGPASSEPGARRQEPGAASEASITLGLGLAGALWKLWDVRGHVIEGRERLTQLLAHPAASRPSTERASALYGAGYLAWCQSDYDAARAAMEESLAIRRALGERQRVGETLGSLGAMALFLEEYDSARSLLEESRAIWQELGDALGLADALARLGELERALGNRGPARALQEESLAIRRAAGATWDIGYCLWSLGNIAFDEGELPEAGTRYREALRTVREVGDKSNLPYLLEPIGAVAAAEGEAERAVALLGASARLRERFGVPLLPGPAATIERQLAGLRAALGEERFAAAWAAGRAMSVEQAVACALEPE